MARVNAELPTLTFPLIRHRLATLAPPLTFLAPLSGELLIGSVTCSAANSDRTNHYFLMSRFMFPFMLIALFFATLSLFLGLLALCTRIGSYLSSVLAWIAWVFQVITTSLMT
jgi:hypothetical protein